MLIDGLIRVVDRWFDTSNYNPADKRPLTIGRNKKVMRKMKDELGGVIMTHFVALRSKCYAYVTNDGSSTKKMQRNQKF